MSILEVYMGNMVMASIAVAVIYVVSTASVLSVMAVAGCILWVSKVL